MNEQIKHKPKPHSKKTEAKPELNRDLKDAYKFAIFAIRTALAAVTGKVFGDSNVDAALGDAIATIYNPQDIADQGTQYNIALSGAAGAWKAVEGGSKWE
jgi:hypothetical protein